MNINYLLSLILIALAMIYIVFEPMKIKKLDSKEVPLFSLGKFTLYELDKFGLTTLMKGSSASRYSNRYNVEDIDYTDNSNEFRSNMKSNKGLYKADVVYLDGNVYFTRVDGLKYFSQKAVYNKKTDIVYSKVDYVANMNKNIVYGDNIEYNNRLERMKSNNVYAVYKIKENK